MFGFIMKLYKILKGLGLVQAAMILTVFIYIPSSWVKIRWHTENKLPRYPPSGQKVYVNVTTCACGAHKPHRPKSPDP